MNIYVVSDSFGFVAAFPSQEAARREVIDKYPSSRFLLMQCRLCERPSAGSPTETIYVIPYRDIDAVAYVSNDPVQARKAHECLLSIGLTYPDDIEYWKYVVGQIPDSVGRRLASLEIALGGTYSREDAQKDNDAVREGIDRLERPGREMMARLERETARLDITAHMCLVFPPEGGEPQTASEGPLPALPEEEEVSAAAEK